LLLHGSAERSLKTMT